MAVVFTGMIKEAIIDYKRYRSDKETNNKACLVWDNQQQGFESRKWEELKVGDIVKLLDKQSVPADLIVMATSEPSGIAYCSTATLDGERTLKFKQAIDEI